MKLLWALPLVAGATFAAVFVAARITPSVPAPIPVVPTQSAALPAAPLATTIASGEISEKMQLKAVSEGAGEPMLSPATGSTIYSSAVKVTNYGVQSVIVKECLLNGKKSAHIGRRSDVPDLFYESTDVMPRTLDTGESAYFVIVGAHSGFENEVVFVDVETDQGKVRVPVTRGTFKKFKT